ncbi:MAG: YCF48-related protein, partial [Bacteroidota bacterium]|nr:YCF48-related protein [Bacteroidota bacterium]MDX5431490.1 YCF48-related protein [Bacteroidota bacterium]MDX5470214.1 YCF48-related protein [Bacteroidota bacterium]
MKLQFLKVLSLFSACGIFSFSNAQCTLDAGADDTLICGESMRVELDAGWSLKSSGTNSDLFAIDFPSKSIGFACGSGGRMLKSINAGASFDTLASFTAYTLRALHFWNESVGLVAGDNGHLFRTLDGGMNWDSIYTGSSGSLFTLQFVTSRIGFLGGDNGTMLKSTDSGKVWTSATTGLPSGSGIQVHSLNFVDSLTGFASVGNQIFKTTNGGQSWNALTPSFVVTYKDLFFLNKDTGFACGVAGVTFVIRTTDGGQTWQQVLTQNGGSFQSLGMTANQTLVLVGSGIWKSSDLGINWRYSASAPQSDFDQYLFWFTSLSCKNFSQGIAVGPSGKIYRNNLIDSVVWSPSLGINDSTSASPVFSPTFTNTYFVSARVDSSCVAYDDITLYVKPLLLKPIYSQVASCEDTVLLKAETNLPSSISHVHFEWTPAKHLDDPNSSMVKALVKENVTYQVKVNTPNACSDSLSVKIGLDFGFALKNPNPTTVCGVPLQIQVD